VPAARVLLGLQFPSRHNNGGNLKSFISMLALAIAVAVTGPAFAGDAASAKNKADCEAAGGTWNADASTCAAADQQ